LRRDALTQDAIKHLIGGVTMEQKIITQEAFTLCGVEGKTSKNNNRIAGIWRKIFKMIGKIPEQLEPGVMYGVGEFMNPAEFTDDTDFHYMAGVRVKRDIQVPKGLTKKEIPESRWAVFTHKGGIDTLLTTYDYIYGPWALKTSEEIREADDYEYYDSRFNPRDPAGSEIDIYVPIK
jgi:AraC family transcriptional regulator